MAFSRGAEPRGLASLRVLLVFTCAAAACGQQTSRGAPGAYWSCTCACDDPSASGATISAQIHGCADTTLDENDATDRRQACAQVCTGQGWFCGGSACNVGTCGAPAANATARLVAPNACDPGQPQPTTRVAEAADYHVTFDPARSSMTLRVRGVEARQACQGEVYFDLLPGVPTLVDLTDIEWTTQDFSTAKGDFTHLRVATGEHTSGQMSDTDFSIYSGMGVLVIRWRWDGRLSGINVVNHDQPWQGSLDPPTRSFVLDLSGADPEHPDWTLTAHLEGSIDNVPPVAVAGEPEVAVPCTARAGTEVLLDGTASYDPDPGDAITHHQWMSRSGPLGNQPTATVSVPLGEPTEVFLTVYDRQLGASSTSVRITVVDTDPPCP